MKHHEKTPPMQAKQRPLYQFIVFSVALFITIILLASVAYMFSMRQIIWTNKSSELKRILESEKIKLENTVNGKISAVSVIAHSPVIINFFVDPKNKELEAMALEEMDAYGSVLSGTTFWINDIDKMFHSKGGEAYTVDPDASENYWYNKTLYETEMYNFNINYNPELEVTNLWVNAPVFDKKHKPLGMIGVGVNISEFIDSLYKQHANRATHYFFNDAGEVTGAKEFELVAKKMSVELIMGRAGVGVLDKALLLKPDETLVYNSPNCKVALIKIPTLGWYSVALMPDTIEDYKNHVTTLFIVMLGVMALIFIIFNIFIADFTGSLRKALDKLETTSKYKSEFLATMSHEIRTPMNAILGMAELALREEMSKRAQEHVLTIRTSGTNLLYIINDILDFSKIESGKMTIVTADYHFPTLVNDVANIIKIRAADTHLDFTVDVDEKIPQTLHGDDLRIRQVMLNILSNAIKYTVQGFVKLTIKGTLVDEDSIMLTIEVADSGKGIKEEDIDKLFKSFGQVDLAKNKGIEGTGLGLAITSNLVKAMGGNVSLRSEYGKGSTFAVTLPQKISRRELEAPAEKKAALMFTAPSARILVVDDVETNLQVAQGLLETYESQIDTCLSGAEAIEAVRKNDYDIVFMDHLMPEMDGLEATARIRKLPGKNHAKLPIIALTANAASDMRAMFLKNGFNDYLSKPIDTSALHTILEKWIPAEKHVTGAKPATDTSGTDLPKVAAAPSSKPDITAKVAATPTKTEPSKTDITVDDIVIEGIDAKLGLSRVAGKINMYLKILGMFCKDGRAKIVALKETLDNNDMKLYTTYAHALKSASANIGAMDISNSALELELAGREGNRELIDSANGKFSANLESLLNNIDNYLKSIQPAETQRKSADMGAVKAELVRLKTAIDNMDVSAINNTAKDLRQFADDAKVGADINKILQDTLIGEYDGALETINKMLSA